MYANVVPTLINTNVSAREYFLVNSRVEVRKRPYIFEYSLLVYDCMKTMSILKTRVGENNISKAPKGYHEWGDNVKETEMHEFDVHIFQGGH